MSTRSWKIVQALPALRTKIIEQMVGDPGFQTLCCDYERCFEALQRFREQSVSVPDRIVEYEELLAELEQEIREAMAVQQRDQGT